MHRSAPPVVTSANVFRPAAQNSSVSPVHTCVAPSGPTISAIHFLRFAIFREDSPMPIPTQPPLRLTAPSTVARRCCRSGSILKNRGNNKYWPSAAAKITDGHSGRRKRGQLGVEQRRDPAGKRTDSRPDKREERSPSRNVPSVEGDDPTDRQKRQE